jgi:hypothetical protein
MEAVQGTLHFTKPLDADTDPRVKDLRNFLTSQGGPADAWIRGGYGHGWATLAASWIAARGFLPVTSVHSCRNSVIWL